MGEIWTRVHVLSGHGYLGCFYGRHQLYGTKASVTVNMYTAQTALDCLDTFCQGYRFAGINRHERECRCWNHALPAWTLTQQTLCEYPCEGDSQQSCGGGENNYIFALWERSMYMLIIDYIKNEIYSKFN